MNQIFFEKKDVLETYGFHWSAEFAVKGSLSVQPI